MNTLAYKFLVDFCPSSANSNFILPTKNVDGKGKFRKKLMDEVEHDIMNYQNRFDNSWKRKTEIQ